MLIIGQVTAYAENVAYRNVIKRCRFAVFFYSEVIVAVVLVQNIASAVFINNFICFFRNGINNRINIIHNINNVIFIVIVVVEELYFTVYAFIYGIIQIGEVCAADFLIVIVIRYIVA